MRQMVVNTGRREGAAACRGESNQLPADSGLMLLDSSARHASRCLAASGGSPPFGGASHQRGALPQAAFIFIAARRYHNPRPERPSNLRTLGAKAPSIFRTFFPPSCFREYTPSCSGKPIADNGRCHSHNEGSAAGSAALFCYFFMASSRKDVFTTSLASSFPSIMPWEEYQSICVLISSAMSTPFLST